ncbi:hypothetical protein niasHT_004747 [Heterodera trifolii]|uniref:Domain of unknown function DB domain-containing protein n=1 Tax=Heterodera trifolii TaxID=157864 RepID=A0ABD2M9G5_9BILA
MLFPPAIAMPMRMTVMFIILEQQASIFGIDHDIRSTISEDSLTASNGNGLTTIDQLMARREHFFGTLRRQKHRRMAKKMYEKARDRAERGRILLSNERGIEPSPIILMPIDQPKVLTAETFASGRSRRVKGEAQANGGAQERKPINGPSAEIRPANLQIATDKHTDSNANAPQNTVVDGPIFPADYWQLPPALLAARLRRFSKADIVRSLRQNARRMGVDGGKLRAVMRHIEIMRREEAQLRNHRHYQLPERKNHAPSVSFLVDHDSFHRSVDVIDSEKVQSKSPFAANTNSRAKFQNKDGLTKLMATEESDLDLLNPPTSAGGAEFESYRKLYKKGQTYNNYVQNHHPRPLPYHATQTQQLHKQVYTAPREIGFVPSNARRPVSQAPITQIQTAATVLPLPLATVSAAVTVSPLMTPNAKLELCCQKQQLPSTCQQFCNFDTFTQEKLLIALLGSHCPSAQLSKAFDCATSKVDHSECCRQEGIDRIHNGQCMVFCRTHIKTPPNVAGYVSCLSVFGTIKNCYRDHQIKHKNLFGD